MEKTKINIGKTRGKYLETLWGGPMEKTEKNIGQPKNVGKTKWKHQKEKTKNIDQKTLNKMEKPKTKR